METFFFGNSDRQLFGAYHPARRTSASVGCVLCPPIGPEYIRSHRVYHLLANALAERGIHCLRFDLSGCGDSQDRETGGPTLDDWCDDFSTAVAELRDGTGVDEICAFGLRLGGTIAFLSAAQLNIETMVLWNPILDGSRYLEELKQSHAEWLQGSFALNRVNGPNCERDEAMGIVIDGKLQSQLQMLNLLVPKPEMTGSALLVDTKCDPDIELIETRLRTAGVHVDTSRLPYPPVWIKQDDDDISVPMDVLSAVSDWLEGERT